MRRHNNVHPIICLSHSSITISHGRRKAFQGVFLTFFDPKQRKFVLESAEANYDESEI